MPDVRAGQKLIRRVTSEQQAAKSLSFDTPKRNEAMVMVPWTAWEDVPGGRAADIGDWSVDNDEARGTTAQAIRDPLGVVAIAVVEGIDEASEAAVEEVANLISAAPDLLDAARDASLELAYLIEQVKARPNGSVSKAFQKLNAAMAKAAGQKPE